MIQKLKKLLALPKPYKRPMLYSQAASTASAIGKFYNNHLTKRWNKIEISDAEKVDASRTFVTAIPNVIAGIGHTLAEYNAGVTWAKHTGATYLHCPLLEPWESYLNFGHDQAILSDSAFSKLRRYNIPRIKSNLTKEEFAIISQKMAVIASEQPTLFILGSGQNCFDHTITSNELRSRYWANNDFSQRLDLRKPDKINIAVHVRRRNAMDMSNKSVHDTNSSAYKSRYLDSQYFIRICKSIEEILGKDRVHFNIYSQGDEKNFEEFSLLENFSLRLETDQYETFHNLVLSDILIVSPSSFSFKAGMLCKGVKIAQTPWWHHIPDNEEWIPITSEMSSEEITDKLKDRVKFG